MKVDDISREFGLCLVVDRDSEFLLELANILVMVIFSIVLRALTGTYSVSDETGELSLLFA